MSARITLRVTAPQLRCINSALALLEAEVETDHDVHTESLPLVERTRTVVHRTMAEAGVQP